MKLPRTRVAVIDVVALSRQMMEHMPRLSAWAEGRRVSSFPPAFPALTCSAQSTYVTGLSSREHAIPGNGWYNRNMSEIQFWKQSNKLVQGPDTRKPATRIHRPGIPAGNPFRAGRA